MTTRWLLLDGWTWRPVVVGALVIALTAHAARYRLRHPGRTAAAFGAAALVGLALLSPIDLLARGTLFSAHMLQHLLLVLGAPPLALLALPRSFQTGARRAPAVIASWVMGVGAMWVWHAPLLCNAAATSEWVRALQTLTLLASGACFWWPVLGPRLYRRLPHLCAVAYLFSACTACSVLGITIAFSPVEVCSAYVHPADSWELSRFVRESWGLTPAVDQQLGGLLMWIPGCIVYATAILAVLAQYFRGAAPQGAP